MEVYHGKDFDGPSVDPAFVRTLFLLDDHLEVRWNPKVERHIIGRQKYPDGTRRKRWPTDDPRDHFSAVFHVEDGQGGYAAPGMREIARLALSDMWNDKSIEHFGRRVLEELDEDENYIERWADEERQELVKDVHKHIDRMPQRERFW